MPDNRNQNRIKKGIALAAPTLALAGTIAAGGMASAAPAMAAAPANNAKLSYSKTALSPQETVKVSGQRQRVSARETENEGKIHTQAVTYDVPDATGQYYLIATAAETAPNAKAMRREMSRTDGGTIVRSQYNSQKQSGHVIAIGEQDVTVDNPDGTTTTVHVQIVGSARYQGKKAAVSYVMVDPTAGGTTKGAIARADKASAAVAKHYQISA